MRQKGEHSIIASFLCKSPSLLALIIFKSPCLFPNGATHCLSFNTKPSSHWAFFSLRAEPLTGQQKKTKNKKITAAHSVVTVSLTASHPQGTQSAVFLWNSDIFKVESPWAAQQRSEVSGTRKDAAWSAFTEAVAAAAAWAPQHSWLFLKRLNWVQTEVRRSGDKDRDHRHIISSLSVVPTDVHTLAAALLSLSSALVEQHMLTPNLRRAMLLIKNSCLCSVGAAEGGGEGGERERRWEEGEKCFFFGGCAQKEQSRRISSTIPVTHAHKDFKQK